MKRSLFHALTLLLTCCGTTFLCAQDPFSIGETITVNSGILQEKREIHIYLPQSYAGSTTHYPVLYILDGDKPNFQFISGIVRYYNFYDLIPELIVVGIPNLSFASRSKDLSPTHSTKNVFGDYTPQWENSGGGSNFLRFVKDELMPGINASYRTLDFNFLLGHSLGGLFSLFALKTNPDLFRGYIAVSPSLWWDNEMILKAMDSLLIANRNLRAKLYLSYEADFSPAYHEEARNKRLETALGRNRSANLKWKYDFLPKETHQSMLVPSAHNGLLYLFDYWPLSTALLFNTDLKDADSPALIRALDDHYARIKEESGIVTDLLQRTLTSMVNFYWSQGKIETTTALCLRGESRFPRADYFEEKLGEVFFKKKDYNKAKYYYEKALSLNPDNREAKEGLSMIK